MSDLLSHPLWRPEDLGRPMPDSPHANSVCLPCWQDNVGYEEGDPRVVDRLAAGYPRFVFHPLTRRLFDVASERFGDAEHACMAFPTVGAARRCAAFMASYGKVATTVHDFGTNGMHVVRFPRAHAALAKKFWQHGGEGISSRQAELTLAGTAPGDTRAAKVAIRTRVAALAGAPLDHVFLLPSGMAAIYLASRAIGRMFPARRSLQYGFPYVDTLKVQQDLAPGAHFYPRGDGSELPAMRDLVAGEALSAIYAECPSNPLLTTPDLDELRTLSDRQGIPLVVDDTIGTFYNLDVLPHVDVLTTSLTKYFSGSGDVMAGSVVVNPRSALAPRLLDALRAEYDDLLWGPDVDELAQNSADFETRVARTNETAVQLADWLAAHPRVAQLYHPSRTTRATYDKVRRAHGGYGGLMSIMLADADRLAPPFFDALEICKGPNLGTRFSLCCPYTILAHYGELDQVEAHGVSRYLIRLSVGLESFTELRDRFTRAFAVLDDCPASPR